MHLVRPSDHVRQPGEQDRVHVSLLITKVPMVNSRFTCHSIQYPLLVTSSRFYIGMCSIFGYTIATQIKGS